MIQEMFMQIDYNGDGGSDWNEFTTFLSLTGLSDQSSLNSGAGGDQQIGLNEYKIEYSEDPGRRDAVTHPLNMLYQQTLSVQYTFSTHPLNVLYQ